MKFFKPNYEQILREIYFKKWLTPTIQKMFSDESCLFHDRDVFNMLLEDVYSAPEVKDTQDAIFAFRFFLKRTIEVYLLTCYDGILNYDVGRIAEKIIGHPENDFEWIERFDGIKRKQ